MRPLVSIVVPAYNAEHSLAECLTSLQTQTERCIEVICVNDGSKDDTLQIMRRFADADNRFSVLTGGNAGYGAACNKGLNAAKGKYVTIFEGDDYCKPDFYRDLSQIAEREECDFVKSDLHLYWSKDKTEYRQIYPDALYGFVLKPRTIFDVYNVFEAQPSVWSAIYRKNFITDNNICFLESPGAAYQDTSFAIKVHMYAQRAYFVKKAYVYYRQHDGQSIKKKGNAYAICNEFREIERCFPMTPELFACKFHCYIWNYRRLGVEFKLGFLKRFSNDFSVDVLNSPDIINPQLFHVGEVQMLMEIVQAPEDFHRKYAAKIDFNRGC